MSKSLVTLPVERVEQAILLIRGEKVILDSDLAALHGVETLTSSSCQAKPRAVPI